MSRTTRVRWIYGGWIALGFRFFNSDFRDRPSRYFPSYSQATSHLFCRPPPTRDQNQCHTNETIPVTLSITLWAGEAGGGCHAPRSGCATHFETISGLPAPILNASDQRVAVAWKGVPRRRFLVRTATGAARLSLRHRPPRPQQMTSHWPSGCGARFATAWTATDCCR